MTEHDTGDTERCECGREAHRDGQCRVCADPGAYSATVDSSGTSKSREQKQKEDHVW